MALKFDLRRLDAREVACNNDLHTEEDSGMYTCAKGLGLSLNPVWIDPEAIARRLPNLLREIKIDFGTSDKIFSSQWLSETELLIGSKCNKLFLVDLSNNRKLEIPRLSKAGALPSSTSCCGIHSISVSPGGEYVATGGHNPNYLALYSLPDILPLALGELHRDWIFDIQWLSSNLLITASRDSTMGLWSVNNPSISSSVPGDVSPSSKDSSMDEGEMNLAECAPVMDPIFHFSNLPTDPHSLHSIGERVRSLSYNSHSYELASLQTNPCGGNIHFWDAFLFQQVSRVSLPYCAENVCLEVDADGTQLYAVGSRSHVTFIDPRQSSTHIANSIRSPDKDCGVRSLAFNQQLLSIGTGAGHLYFYDLRINHFILDSTLKPCVLTASQGWLKHDQTYQDFFSGLPRPANALYTHCYSPLRTKIFSAGGPLPLGLCGNYASVWM